MSTPSIGDIVQITYPTRALTARTAKGIVVGVGLPLLFIRCEHVIALDKYVIRHVNDVRTVTRTTT